MQLYPIIKGFIKITTPKNQNYQGERRHPWVRIPKNFIMTRTSLRRTPGIEFEGQFLDAITCDLSTADSIEITRGSTIDKCQGTDFIFDDIRVDITANFRNKDNLVFISRHRIRTAVGDIRFGIRTGNSHNGGTSFDEPVVVVGTNIFGRNIMTHKNDIFDEIAMKAPAILDGIVNTFFDFIDEQDKFATATAALA